MPEQPFDRFLAEALSPPEREPDRSFVLQVQAIVKLDERLRASRIAALRRLGFEALAVGAFGAGLTWLVRSPEIASAVGESPAAALSGLIAAFALLVGLFSVEQTAREAGSSPD